MEPGCPPTVVGWTCHSCRQWRPDDEIGVLSRDLSELRGLRPGTIRVNVRYCVDNARCFDGAIALLDRYADAMRRPGPAPDA